MSLPIPLPLVNVVGRRRGVDSGSGKGGANGLRERLLIEIDLEIGLVLELELRFELVVELLDREPMEKFDEFEFMRDILGL